MLQGSVRSNAILFGLPLGTALLGENNMGMVTIIIAIIVPFWSIMSVIGFSLYSDTKLSVQDMAKTVMTNPMVIATIIGVIAVLLNIQLPIFLDTSLTNVTRMVAPLALMVLGGTFSIDNIKESKAALIFTLAIKLVIFPMIALTLGAFLGFRNDAIISILIAFAGPTEVSSYAQAVAAGADGKLANQIVVISTILSIVMLVIWISLLKAFGLF
jgi:predicted permease